MGDMPLVGVGAKPLPIELGVFMPGFCCCCAKGAPSDGMPYLFDEDPPGEPIPIGPKPFTGRLDDTGECEGPARGGCIC